MISKKATKATICSGIVTFNNAKVIKEVENKGEKKVHYMKSKRPRIFQDIKAEGEETVDSEVDNLTKKKKDKKASASLAEEDYVYYPEDYFY